MPIETTINGTKTVPWGSPPVGLSNPLTGEVNLNSAVNWYTPNVSFAMLDGAQTIENMLLGEAQSLGIASMTSAQFMDIILLHELARVAGRVGNPDKAAVESRLFRDCIQ